MADSEDEAPGIRLPSPLPELADSFVSPGEPAREPPDVTAFLKRPGVGFFSPAATRLDLPVLPQPSVLSATAGEALEVLREGGLAEALRKQCQRESEKQPPMYSLQLPKGRLYEEWVGQHMHPFRSHGAEELKQAFAAGQHPTETREALKALQDATALRPVSDAEEEFAGMILTVPVSQERMPGKYQDGTPHVPEEMEMSLYHATREGLLHSILGEGVFASIPAHGTEGLWAFALFSPETFAWGHTCLETTRGLFLHLRTPVVGEHLQQNRRIRAGGEFGFLRWVVSGQNGRPNLRCRVVAVSFLLPTAQEVVWKLGLKTAIRNCVSWAFGYCWENSVLQDRLARRLRQEASDLVARKNQVGQRC